MLKGKVHKYGANVDTDVIIPARYLSLSEPAELAEHCMEDIDKEFVIRVKPGDIITKINGQTIDAENKVPDIVSKSKVGRQLQLSVLRDGQQSQLNATIAESPNQ